MNRANLSNINDATNDELRGTKPNTRVASCDSSHAKPGGVFLHTDDKSSATLLNQQETLVAYNVDISFRKSSKNRVLSVSRNSGVQRSLGTTSSSRVGYHSCHGLYGEWSPQGGVADPSSSPSQPCARKHSLLSLLCDGLARLVAYTLLHLRKSLHSSSNAFFLSVGSYKYINIVFMQSQT